MHQDRLHWDSGLPLGTIIIDLETNMKNTEPYTDYLQDSNQTVLESAAWDDITQADV